LRLVGDHFEGEGVIINSSIAEGQEEDSGEELSADQKVQDQRGAEAMQTLRTLLLPEASIS